jgi:hypothetical protein
MNKPECKCKNSKTATDVTGLPYCVLCGGVGKQQEAEDIWPKN